MAKHLHRVDSLIAGALLNGIREADLTYRDVAKTTGMSLNRVGIILRQQPPPATVGEVGLIAAAFGATASEIVARAEDERRREQIVADVVAADQNGVAADWALAAHEGKDETRGEFEDGESGDGV